ncbi:MAG: hypothetical protein H6738_04385 [Alphaproteobacteria bacterium]|nr:hypothetical protein [Alphaproteobacteria bacterium]MCB9696010.1 hypothetical protein [Alphaproteobacteria bacterium]
MRTTLIPLLLLACADTEDPDFDLDGLERGDETPTLGPDDHMVIGSCVDEECQEIRFSLAPEAKASWSVDGRDAGFGDGIVLPVSEVHGIEVAATLSPENRSTATVWNHGPNTVIFGIMNQINAESCKKFTIHTVGGCLVNPLTVTFEGLATPVDFRRANTSSAWIFDPGPAWGGWWPNGYNPIDLQPYEDDLEGLGFLYQLPSNTSKVLSISHDGSPFEYLGEANCSASGVASITGVSL